MKPFTYPLAKVQARKDLTASPVASFETKPDPRMGTVHARQQTACGFPRSMVCVETARSNHDEYSRSCERLECCSEATRVGMGSTHEQSGFAKHHDGAKMSVRLVVRLLPRITFEKLLSLHGAATLRDGAAVYVRNSARSFEISCC